MVLCKFFVTWVDPYQVILQKFLLEYTQVYACTCSHVPIMENVHTHKHSKYFMLSIQFLALLCVASHRTSTFIYRSDSFGAVLDS